MDTRKIIKKMAIIIIIVSLSFSLIFLSGFSGSWIKMPKRPDKTVYLDEGEKNGIGKGLNIEDLISLVEETTSKHLAILQEVLENAPASAQKGIERAIAVSIRGSIKAIEALNKIKSSNKDNGNNGQKTFHIISSCNRGGTIDPKGIQFTQGESVSFEIITDEGYSLVWLRVDNKKIEATSSYSFDDVDGNHTIHAHFKKIKNSIGQGSE